MPRVLEVQKGQLCWIVGTVYMEMALKPNILEDIGKDVSAFRLAQSESHREHLVFYPTASPSKKLSVGRR